MACHWPSTRLYTLSLDFNKAFITASFLIVASAFSFSRSICWISRNGYTKLALVLWVTFVQKCLYKTL